MDKNQKIIAVSLVALVGAGAVWFAMYKNKKEAEGTVNASTVRRMPAAAAGGEGAYECYNFMNQCEQGGSVGGCKQYEDTCRSAQSVRMSGRDTPQGSQECNAFRSQCIGGNYTSCNLYQRGCTKEGQN